MRAQLFIAHSIQDTVWRERLTTMLTPLMQVGLSCWDETQIQPGQHRQEEIAAALGGARVALLLISPEFLASEFILSKELSAMLATAWHEQRLRILWVVVKPCLWQQSMFAKYQPAHDSATPLSTLSDSDADSALVAICQRINLAMATTPASIENAPSRNPYRGLSAFQINEAHLFFGRESLTEKLWQRFKALYDKSDSTRLLAVLGPSGSGKSSVARAGLLAALDVRPVPGTHAIRRVVLKPGGHPLRVLARALLSLPSGQIPSPDLRTQRKLMADVAQQNTRGEFDGLTLWAANLPDVDAVPLVILVDQFEEIYTLCTDRAERDAFAGALLHAASDSDRHVSIILTLRSDFLGETQRHHPELNRLFGDQAEIVTVMSRDELRRAIAKPAEQARSPIDDATVELLLTETRGSEGALPLLEFALTRIWEGMMAGNPPGATLREIEGVGGALACKAQAIYQTLGDREQVIARRALVRLVQLGDGTKDTRRRAPLCALGGRDETPAEVLQVLRQFATEHARLVTLSGDSDDAIAEVTHEALFEHWTDLRRWIDEGRADRRFHDRVSESAKLWDEAGQPAGRLWRSPDLDLLRAYQRRHPEELSSLQGVFLAAAEHQQRRDRLLSWGSALAVLTAIFIAAGIYITKEQQRTHVERQRAVEVAASREQIRQQLLSSYVEQGRRLLFSEEKPLEALPWLHRAQREGATDTVLLDLLRNAMWTVDSTKQVLVGHRDSVLMAVYSPDGHRILTASADKTARIWETETGRLVAELKGHADSVLSAAYSPDGHRILTASADKTARLWEAETGRLAAELKGHGDKVASAVYSPDGHRILTASWDKTARLWEAETGRFISELKGHGDRVLSATYSPDGRYIATASWDHTVRVWEAETSRLIAELKGHRDKVASATYSPDSRRIVTASSDHTARVWEVETGRFVAELKGHRGAVLSARYSPDGRRIVTASWDQTARVWEAETGRLVTELKGHGDRHFSELIATYSPDGRLIVTVLSDETARIWDAETGRRVAELYGHGDAVLSATYSSDGRHILTASEDKTTRVWDAEAGRLIAGLTGHGDRVLNATYSPGGGRIVTASLDRTARVWEAGTGLLISELKGHGDTVLTATYSPDGRRIVTASPDQTARVWDVETGRLIINLKGHSAGLLSAMYSPDGLQIVTSSWDKTARVWDAETGRLITELKGHGASVKSAKYSPDCLHIATASSDQTARIWEAETGHLIAELKGHGDSVLNATYSPDGHRIVTASWDKTARVWDSETGRLLSELKGHGNRVLSATYSPDGRRIVTASEDKTARIWEAETGRLIAELKGHGDTVWSATYSPDGRRIATASSDKTARIWEAETGRLVAELKGHADSVVSASYSLDGQRIVTASSDNTSRVWDVAGETRTASHIGKLIRCYVPLRFERENGNVLVPTIPDPTECQGGTRPSP